MFSRLFEFNMHISITIFPKTDPRHQYSQTWLCQNGQSQGGGSSQNGGNLQLDENFPNGVNTQISGNIEGTDSFQVKNHLESPESYCQRFSVMYDRNNPRTLPVPDIELSCALNDLEINALWDETMKAICYVSEDARGESEFCLI